MVECFLKPLCIRPQLGLQKGPCQGDTLVLISSGAGAVFPHQVTECLQPVVNMCALLVTEGQ
jgi:hypothetical protein